MTTKRSRFETDCMVFICVQPRRASFVRDDREHFVLVCQARHPAYAAGREGFSPKDQHLETNREMESTTVSSTAGAD